MNNLKPFRVFLTVYYCCFVLITIILLLLKDGRKAELGSSIFWLDLLYVLTGLFVVLLLPIKFKLTNRNKLLTFFLLLLQLNLLVFILDRSLVLSYALLVDIFNGDAFVEVNNLAIHLVVVISFLLSHFLSMYLPKSIKT